MSLKLHFRRLILPLLTMTVTVALATFQRDLPGAFADSQKVALFLKASVYLSSAWLASRVLAMILDQAAGKRPYPRLLKDLIAAALFTIALAATGALYMGQGAIGALAGSGIVLALLGFAIRNVVADTLSGIALAMEAPFRIGDWVDIDTLALAKVIEIGWRTTRLQTPDATYMILPNSQIARHRITNFSAPKREFRSQVNITLDHVLPIDKARAIMVAALGEAKLIQQSPAPDVRVRSYEEAGICYTVRYWVPRFEQAVDCRDEVFRLIDEALRKAGSIAPYRRIQLINSPVVSAQDDAEE